MDIGLIGFESVIDVRLPKTGLIQRLVLRVRAEEDMNVLLSLCAFHGTRSGCS